MSGKGGEIEETAEERTLADIGMDQRTDWEENWRPVENLFIADTLDTEPERREGMGIAAYETSKAFARARPKVEAGLQSVGAKPGSGRFNAAVTGMAGDEGYSRGMGAVDVEQAVEDNKYRGLMGLTQMGQGKRADALAGLSDVAGLSSRQAALDAQYAAADRASWGSAIGEGVGGVVGGLSDQAEKAGEDEFRKKLLAGLPSISESGAPA